MILSMCSWQFCSDFSPETGKTLSTHTSLIPFIMNPHFHSMWDMPSLLWKSCVVSDRCGPSFCQRPIFRRIEGDTITPSHPIPAIFRHPHLLHGVRKLFCICDGVLFPSHWPQGFIELHSTIGLYSLVRQIICGQQRSMHCQVFPLLFILPTDI